MKYVQWAQGHKREAQLHLIWRLCNASFYDFVRLSWPIVDPTRYIDGWHIREICNHLQALAQGALGNKKLMINIPPGMSKSIIVCVLWPAWCWGPGNMPDLRFMFTSYRGDLALRDGRKCKALIEDPWYQMLWGDRFRLNPNEDGAGRFSNMDKGYRLALPTSGIMGEGGDFVAMDDPHNVKVAESDDVRDEVVRQIRLALPTRVRNWDRGGAVCIMQRLHERDYCGVMLEEEDDWDHLCMPARYEDDHPFPIRSSLGFVDPRKPGELLCEARYSEKQLSKLEIALGGDYGAAGQFQQRPTLRAGGLFKRDKFQYIPASEVPAGGKRCRGWDLAGSRQKKSANTAGVLERLNEGRLYIEHSLVEKWGVDELAQQIRAQADADGEEVRQSYPQDPGSAGVFQVWALAQALHGVDIHSDPESGDKATRAQPLAGQVSARNVWVVQGPWTQAFVDECCSFPLGRQRDQVDAASRAYRSLCDTAGTVDFGSTSGMS
ncbi:MAG: phage terminase large subunit [Myxococcales bacterium]|nr:phage terminase large subunit [Myxococcales bacterium]